ncbi:multidrug effflux MFS transporter [Propionibacteriaceae bacterium Y1923]|uniref:multidrug effflux MFS transporter n=1 Tax=Aestuariimicrobium sp. Y1814 TaxID=3418742 RepID=UPI003C1FADE9
MHQLAPAALANRGDQMTPRRRLFTIITLGLLTALGPFTIDLYLPAFPAIKQNLNITDAQVQVTLSATTLGFALGQLLIGPVSDRLGRKWPLVAMTTLHVTASVLVALSQSLESLTIMRALQGIGAAGGAVVAMAMARDLFSGNRLIKMLSNLALINGLAPIIAPLLGSWLVTFVDWRGVFWVLACYGALIVVLVVTLIVESRPPAERTTGGITAVFAAYRRVLSDRIYVGVWLVAALAFGGLFSYVASSSVLLQEGYGLTPQGFGAVFATCSVGVFVGVQTGSRLAAKVGPQWILVAGTALMVVAATAFLLLHSSYPTSYVVLVPALFAYTTGFGACMPTAQVLALQNHRTDSGVAASLMGALNMLMAAMVGPVLGRFDMTSPVPLGVAMLVCAGLATACLWTIVRPRQLQVSFD